MLSSILLGLPIFSGLFQTISHTDRMEPGQEMEKEPVVDTLIPSQWKALSIRRTFALEALPQRQRLTMEATR